MNNTHTPGPWKHDSPKPGQMTQVFTGDNPTDGYLIGYVIHESVNKCQQPVDEANARLIAASPELLEALKAITDCWGMGTSPDQFCEQVADFMKEGRAAIAKATE